MSNNGNKCCRKPKFSQGTNEKVKDTKKSPSIKSVMMRCLNDNLKL